MTGVGVRWKAEVLAYNFQKIMDARKPMHLLGHCMHARMSAKR